MITEQALKRELKFNAGVAGKNQIRPNSFFPAPPAPTPPLFLFRSTLGKQIRDVGLPYDRKSSPVNADFSNRHNAVKTFLKLDG